MCIFVGRLAKSKYGVQNAPSDTYLRERLDEVSPTQLRRGFKQIFAYLQRGKALEQFRYLDGYHIISIDGTGQVMVIPKMTAVTLMCLSMTLIIIIG